MVWMVSDLLTGSGTPWPARRLVGWLIVVRR